jgi:hypothetical protein
MAKNNEGHGNRGDEGIGKTRLRSPFTAGAPDEFGQAGWIQNPPSLPDESADDFAIDGDVHDPLGLIPPKHIGKGERC